MIISKFYGRLTGINNIRAIFLNKLLAQSSPNITSILTIRALATNDKPTGPIGEHSKLFKIERIASAVTLPLVPLSYFVHGYGMDYLLIAVIVVHCHWLVYFAFSII